MQSNYTTNETDLYNNNCTAVFSGHVRTNLNLAAKFASQVILLHHGKVLASGNKEEVLTKVHIKTAYQLEPVIHKENNAMYLFFE